MRKPKGKKVGRAAVKKKAGKVSEKQAVEAGGFDGVGPVELNGSVGVNGRDPGEKKDERPPQTAEGIAYRLLVDILQAEGRSGAMSADGSVRLSRGAYLDAYNECLQVVRGERVSKRNAG